MAGSLGLVIRGAMVRLRARRAEGRISLAALYERLRRQQWSDLGLRSDIAAFNAAGIGGRRWRFALGGVWRRRTPHRLVRRASSGMVLGCEAVNLVALEATLSGALEARGCLALSNGHPVFAGVLTAAHPP